MKNTRGYAVMPVSTEFLERLFCLPEGYRIISMIWRWDTIDFVLSSDALPETPERAGLPTAQLRCIQERLPEHPDFTRITTEVIFD